MIQRSAEELADLLSAVDVATSRAAAQRVTVLTHAGARVPSGPAAVGPDVVAVPVRAHGRDIGHFLCCCPRPTPGWRSRSSGVTRPWRSPTSSVSGCSATRAVGRRRQRSGRRGLGEELVDRVQHGDAVAVRPQHPFAVISAPGFTPPTWRRPRKTIVTWPVPSLRVASRVAAPPQGWTRTATTRPVTLPCAAPGPPRSAWSPRRGARPAGGGSPAGLGPLPVGGPRAVGRGQRARSGASRRRPGGGTGRS